MVVNAGKLPMLSIFFLKLRLSKQIIEENNFKGANEEASRSMTEYIEYCPCKNDKTVTLPPPI